nr:unnamed protein product [Digitaria exilis]
MLRNLRHLVLDNNRLIGRIPVELSELTSLQTLWLAYNWFAPSELPASFKNLTNLVSLWVANCSLIGNFPSYVVKMPKLEVLDLLRNRLTGMLPSELGKHSPALSFVGADDNELTGRIPEVPRTIA